MAATMVLLVAASAAASSPKSFGQTDIFEAVKQDSMSLIKQALADGADINQQQEGTLQTPLMNAVLSGKLQAVKYLLKRGADTTIPEKDGYTPMHGAGFQGRKEIAKVLMEHGVPLNDIHKDGYGPLQRACWGADDRHIETCRFMLDAGGKLLGKELEEARSEDMFQMISNWRPENKGKGDDANAKGGSEAGAGGDEL